MSKEKITVDQLQEVLVSAEITIGKVIQVDSIKKSRNLKLTVSFAEDGSDTRSVITNIVDRDLLNKSFPFYTNLVPTEFKGVESHAMFAVFNSTENVMELENYSVGSKLTL